jgi:hypothetical protein
MTVDGLTIKVDVNLRVLWTSELCPQCLLLRITVHCSRVDLPEFEVRGLWVLQCVSDDCA